MTADLEITDVIIIGGSHAGLSAALTLYRACHTSLIFDAGAPRNAKADHVHMMPGFDKKTLNELREVARDELRATGLVRFVAQKVVTATKTPDGLFEVVDGTGKHWKGGKILLAPGVQEKYPDIEGYAENYGPHMQVKHCTCIRFVRDPFFDQLAATSYHCLFCFGYEDRGCSVAAVLADGPLADVAMSTIYASDAKKFAKTVKIYTSRRRHIGEIAPRCGGGPPAFDADYRAERRRHRCQVRQGPGGPVGVHGPFARYASG